MRLICVPKNSGASGNETANEFTRDSSAQQSAGPLATLEISRQNIMQNIMGWLLNQYMTLWQSYRNSDRQSQQLISGTRLTAWDRLPLTQNIV
jgi:hypothetical protein